MELLEIDDDVFVVVVVVDDAACCLAVLLLRPLFLEFLRLFFVFFAALLSTAGGGGGGASMTGMDFTPFCWICDSMFCSSTSDFVTAGSIVLASVDGATAGLMSSSMSTSIGEAGSLFDSLSMSSSATTEPFCSSAAALPFVAGDDLCVCGAESEEAAALALDDEVVVVVVSSCCCSCSS